jgi:Transcriptional Coactivator p15 (PC4)
MESIKIGSVKSGNSEIVVGKFLAKDGKERVDIRLFVTASTEGGYSGPTKKGVTVPEDKVEGLIALLEQSKKRTAKASTS